MPKPKKLLPPLPRKLSLAVVFAPSPQYFLRETLVRGHVAYIKVELKSRIMQLSIVPSNISRRRLRQHKSLLEMDCFIRQTRQAARLLLYLAPNTVVDGYLTCR